MNEPMGVASFGSPVVLCNDGRRENKYSRVMIPVDGRHSTTVENLVWSIRPSQREPGFKTGVVRLLSRKKGIHSIV